MKKGMRKTRRRHRGRKTRKGGNNNYVPPKPVVLGPVPPTIQELKVQQAQRVAEEVRKRSEQRNINAAKPKRRFFGLF